MVLLVTELQDTKLIICLSLSIEFNINTLFK